MFGRATITLGIGPHSSFIGCFLKQLEEESEGGSWLTWITWETVVNRCVCVCVCVCVCLCVCVCAVSVNIVSY